MAINLERQVSLKPMKTRNLFGKIFIVNPKMRYETLFLSELDVDR